MTNIPSYPLNYGWNAQVGLKSLFHINTIPVALSNKHFWHTYFGFFFFFSNTILPVKPLIAFTLVVFGLNFVVQGCSGWGGGGGGGELGAQNSVPSAACSKQQS